jgi:hypothetical protein
MDKEEGLKGFSPQFEKGEKKFSGSKGQLWSSAAGWLFINFSVTSSNFNSN